jgi:hypothetical protein
MMLSVILTATTMDILDGSPALVIVSPPPAFSLTLSMSCIPGAVSSCLICLVILTCSATPGPQGLSVLVKYAHGPSTDYTREAW